MPVLSLVTATIEPDRLGDLTEPYREAIAAGLPVAIRQTFLLVGDDGIVGIATVWKSRDDLDAMRSSGEEPLARRLLREAGGTPDVKFFDIAAEA